MSLPPKEDDDWNILPPMSRQPQPGAEGAEAGAGEEWKESAGEACSLEGNIVSPTTLSLDADFANFLREQGNDLGSVDSVAGISSSSSSSRQQPERKNSAFNWSMLEVDSSGGPPASAPRLAPSPAGSNVIMASSLPGPCAPALSSSILAPSAVTAQEKNEEEDQGADVRWAAAAAITAASTASATASTTAVDDEEDIASFRRFSLAEIPLAGGTILFSGSSSSSISSGSGGMLGDERIVSRSSNASANEDEGSASGEQEAVGGTGGGPQESGGRHNAPLEERTAADSKQSTGSSSGGSRMSSSSSSSHALRSDAAVSGTSPPPPPPPTAAAPNTDTAPTTAAVSPVDAYGDHSPVAEELMVVRRRLRAAEEQINFWHHRAAKAERKAKLLEARDREQAQYMTEQAESIEELARNTMFARRTWCNATSAAAEAASPLAVPAAATAAVGDKAATTEGPEGGTWPSKSAGQRLGAATDALVSDLSDVLSRLCALELQQEEERQQKGHEEQGSEQWQQQKQQQYPQQQHHRSQQQPGEERQGGGGENGVTPPPRSVGGRGYGGGHPLSAAPNPVAVPSPDKAQREAEMFARVASGGAKVLGGGAWREVNVALPPPPASPVSSSSIPSPAAAAGGGGGGTGESLAAEEGLQQHPTEKGISFRSFAAGDLALFFPTSSGHFVAFNVNCPNHYLSDESKALVEAGDTPHFKWFCVLGVVVEVEDERASRGEDSNPYGLPSGTRYRVVSVASIEDK